MTKTESDEFQFLLKLENCLIFCRNSEILAFCWPKMQFPFFARILAKTLFSHWIMVRISRVNHIAKFPPLQSCGLALPALVMNDRRALIWPNSFHSRSTNFEKRFPAAHRLIAVDITFPPIPHSPTPTELPGKVAWTGGRSCAPFPGSSVVPFHFLASRSSNSSDVM